MHSLLFTLALACGLGAAYAMARARPSFRAWAQGTAPQGGATWLRLYRAAEPEPELEAHRRAARFWHAWAVGLLTAALALSVAAALA
jgi:hypothetical protein